MAPVCQGSVLQRVLGLQNEALEDFAARFTTAKWVFGLRNGTRVTEDCFAAAKIFAWGLRLRNDFAEEGLFCSKTSIL